MTRFVELSQTFKQDAAAGDYSQVADQLFTEAHRAHQEWSNLGMPAGYRDEVAEATRKLQEDGVLPMLSAQYLSIEAEGQTNFQDIADNVTDDGVIDREELNGQIDTLEGKDYQFSAALVKELKSNYTEIAGIDGEAGISMSDYNRFIASEKAKLKGETPEAAAADSATDTTRDSRNGDGETPEDAAADSATEAYEVAAGDGFDRIARKLYKDAFGGERPSIALEIELSRRIAELNDNDRDYSNGVLQPGQALKVMSPAELRRLVEELRP